MYAFRKPFAAAAFEGMTWSATEVSLKSALIIAQLLGYTASKFLGIKVVSETSHSRRAVALVALILAAWGALLLLPLLPDAWKPLALLLNGLPLGMVWGLVVSYLEGRRSSDVLLTGLACSFIVSSGAVKDVGVMLMGRGVSEVWMPAAVGAIFLPLFVLSVWLLNRIPPPDAADIAARAVRTPMNGAQRRAFVGRFGPGLMALLAAYFLLTAFRDYRDNFSVELLRGVGRADIEGLMSRSEVLVALGVIASLAGLNAVRSNRAGLLLALAVMAFGVLLVGVSTLLHSRGLLDGFPWVVCTGLGSYLAYVPFNTLLFDRMMAATRSPGTAVFAIYLADATGYVGSIALLLARDVLAAGRTHVEFFTLACWVVAAGGGVLLAFSAWYFHRHISAVPEGRPPQA
jgi:hypothetical protein